MLAVDTEKSLNLATEMLDKLGIPVQDSEGNYRGIDEIITDLSYKWHEIDENNKINVFSYILAYFPVYIEKSAIKVGDSFRNVLEKLK